MAYAVIMPKAGMAMETGKIIKWIKKEGECVEKGEPLLEIETDKVNMEVEAMNGGVLLKVLAHEGDEVPVVRTIGYIGEPGEALPEEDIRPEAGPFIKPVEENAYETPDLKPEGLRVPATPAARRLAREKGIALEYVVPSGSLGHIRTADVTAAGTAEGDVLRPHTAMRRTIAKRMLNSHLNIPPVTQSCVADVTELMALRARINADGGAHVTVSDFIVMAAARALKEQPHINASYTEEGLLVRKHINVGIAVALPDGLIVPVIRDADRLLLSEVSAAARALQAKAKEGRLAADDCTGGTFTISNLGMLGVTAFTPIINGPESAILGVCAAEQRLEMDDDGHIAKRLRMPLCLTYDHRSIDGAQAAIFSNRITQLLENPLVMLA